MCVFIWKKSCACVHTIVCVTACGSMSGTRGVQDLPLTPPPHPSCVRPIAVPSRCMNPVLRPPPRTVSLLLLGPCCPWSLRRGSPAATRGLPAPLGQVPAPPEALRCPHLLTHPPPSSPPLRRPPPPLHGNFLLGSHLHSCPGPLGGMGVRSSRTPGPAVPPPAGNPGVGVRLSCAAWVPIPRAPVDVGAKGRCWRPNGGGRAGVWHGGAGGCAEEGGSQPRRTPHPSPRVEVHSEALTGLSGYTVQVVSSPRHSLSQRSPWERLPPGRFPRTGGRAEPPMAQGQLMGHTLSPLSPAANQVSGLI